MLSAQLEKGLEIMPRDLRVCGTVFEVEEVTITSFADVAREPEVGDAA